MKRVGFLILAALTIGACRHKDEPNKILDGFAAGNSEEAKGYLRERLHTFEADILASAIEDAGGDRKLAALALGISLSSLYRKLDELGRG